MPDFLPYYQDLTSLFGTPATTGGLTAAPGEGLAASPGSGLASAGVEGRVPGQGTSIFDVLEQFGGQQQGSLGERIGGSLGAGFAAPTLANIAKAIQTGLSVASPTAPISIGMGLLADEMGMPAYGNTIASVLAQAAGLPGPMGLPEFEGKGVYPDKEALQRAFQLAGNNTWKIMQLNSMLQKMREGALGQQEAEQLRAAESPFAGMSEPTPGAYARSLAGGGGGQGPNAGPAGGAPQGGASPGGHGEY